MYWLIVPARTIFETRERLLSFFHASDDSEVIFTKNITESLNLVLKGLLKAGDHLVCEQYGAQFDDASFAAAGLIETSAIQSFHVVTVAV